MDMKTLQRIELEENEIHVNVQCFLMFMLLMRLVVFSLFFFFSNFQFNDNVFVFPFRIFLEESVSVG